MTEVFARTPLKFIDERFTEEFMCSADSSFPRMKEEGIPNISFKNSLLVLRVSFSPREDWMNDGFHLTQSDPNGDLSHMEGNTRCGSNSFPTSIP